MLAPFFLEIRQRGVIKDVDMNGYTKLFGSIIASTIWRESKETKIVWITMLAMANKHGIVEASIPGLADMARVGLDETQKALEVLAAPDTFSRTKDFEGRRIEAVDGGWVILNHAKYREKMSADERRQYNRLKQQEFRDRQKRAASNPCQQSSITVNDGQSSSALLSASGSVSEVHGWVVREIAALPECFRHPDFVAQWEIWLVWWSENKHHGKPMSPETAREQLGGLLGYSIPEAVKALKDAIAGNYARPYPPRRADGNGGAPIVSEEPSNTRR